ncbi:MAG: DegT/DnrJ/EryC1/StrS family aminotransferase [Bacteroidetes bacterium]|nr:DegT/DnrJ/EryC1/StrS family aminotransferase [Bacteroidota bacterium]
MSAEFIPLAKPNIQEQDINLVAEVLKSGMLVQGKYVNELENSFINFTKTKYASAVSNGTATLHLALIALGVKTGDEVIVPAFSYMATANVVELVGAKPIFVDIDISTFNIDVTKIESVITSKTKAIIPVHEFGLACDIDSIIAIAKKHNLFVIEDAACALGALYKGKHVGSFGNFGSFSLHPRKAISCGEGGVLITNEETLDSEIKLLRNHGTEITNGKMDFTRFGFNYRMTDFQAALVFSQLPRLNETINYKQNLAEVYFSELKTTKIKLPFVPNYTKHTWQTFHVLVNENINRDELIIKLRDKNIGANYGAQCMPYMKSFKNKYNLNSEELFPNALLAYKQGLALPLYELLNTEQIKYISNTLNQLIS